MPRPSDQDHVFDVHFHFVGDRALQDRLLALARATAFGCSLSRVLRAAVRAGLDQLERQGGARRGAKGGAR